MRDTSLAVNIIFILLEWISFTLWIILTLKYVARKVNYKPINIFLRKTHIPMSIILAFTMTTHAVLSFIEYPNDIATNITGIVLTIAFVFLVLTYVMRKKLKRKWFVSHRIISFISILILIAHIILTNIL